MISRIQLLRNVGQFDSVSTGATIPLARLTVVYSENGRGKTTLAAVMRSLATGDPIPILERKRLSAAHPPHVVVECSTGSPSAVFQNGAWNHSIPDLAVFDDVFIDENVHSGLSVQTHHRQNLHELILGTQAVALSKRLQELVEKIENHNRDLRTKANAIPVADRGPFSVDDFCVLPARADIDQAIQEAERALAAAREQDAVRTTAFFEPLSFPEFNLQAIEQVLQEDLPALEAVTLAQVQQHLAMLGTGGEMWVADGMRRIRPGAGTCPFCAQDFQGAPVIQHYRAYFSDEYAALKRRVADAVATVTRSHGDDVPAAFERAVRVAIERRQFWSRFCQVEDFVLDTSRIARDWRVAREGIVAQLTAKQAAPLDRLAVSADTRISVASYEAHRMTIAAINQILLEANRAIEIAKEQAAAANLTMLASDLARLKAVRARHASHNAGLCDNYLQERAAKEATERDRDQVKTALEQHRTRVFPGYQTAINLYLSNFIAGFRLDSVSYTNTRGGATCTYNVLINNTPVPVGGTDLASGQPSFRNTLSAGDRNTLALVFFFTSLDQDPRLASQVVVIDDPISSLDEHRAFTTVQEIRRLAERVTQVIVLSHNKPFLCRLWERTDPSARAAIELVRDGGGSTLRLWDVAQDSVTEHDRRHAKLRDYVGSATGDRRELTRSIRPHLEAFLRVAYPEDFPPGSMIGPFLGLCEQRAGTAHQILDAQLIQELRDLNEYSRRYHHQGWETEPLNDGELRFFVEKTLKFARR